MKKPEVNFTWEELNYHRIKHALEIFESCMFRQNSHTERFLKLKRDLEELRDEMKRDHAILATREQD